MKHEEDNIVDELEQSAAKLDAIEVAVPDFMFFKDMVDKQQAAMRRAQKTQLALFIIVAAVLVSAIMVCIGRFEVLFFALQAMAFTGAVAGLAVFFARSRKLKEGYR